jgi:energy-coupling factor transporter ATP-binding protein EcfA2
MKIKKLHFADHPFFGTIETDFTDHDGYPLTTVVLAGINGSGKTMIFNHIRELIQKGMKTFFDEMPQSERETDFLSADDPRNRLTVLLTDFEKELMKKYKPLLTGDKDGESVRDLPKFVFLPSEINFERIKITTKPYKYDYTFFNQADENIAKFIPAYFATFIDKKVYENADIPPRQSIRQACDEINAIFEGLDLESELAGLKKDGSRMPVFRNRSGKEFDITALSSGEKQLFFRIMALKMFEVSNSVILADEPEISLHPAWQQRILKLYENIGENNQVIVATHSPHIIGSTSRENLRILTRNGSGSFQITDCNRFWAVKGAPAQRILKDLMGLPTTRDPEIQKKIDLLWERIHKGNFETESFKAAYEEMEGLVGTIDEDMVLMKMEMGKKRWEADKNAENQ